MALQKLSVYLRDSNKQHLILVKFYVSNASSVNWQPTCQILVKSRNTAAFVRPPSKQ